MKTNIIKGGKRVLGFVLAVCILAVSLFTANIGVNINASAVTEKTTAVWQDTGYGNTVFDSFDTFIASMSGAGTSESPYLITTAEQLFHLTTSSTVTADNTTGKYFKVADNIGAFDFTLISGVTQNTTISELESYEASWTWNKFYNEGSTFAGTFDGNGAVIYNYGKQGNKPALFPMVGPNAVIKNVSLKACIFRTGNGQYTESAGAIIGQSKGTWGSTITVENCSVENCIVINQGRTGQTYWYGAGAIAGAIPGFKLTINNCIVRDNVVNSVLDGVNSSLIGYTQVVPTIKNTISIGLLPYATEDAGNTQDITTMAAASNFTNVYTDQTVDTATYSESQVKQFTTANMQGANAQANMSLDFSGTWFANTTTYPVLRVGHVFDTTNNGNGTHSEVCSDCGLVGVPTSHFYNIKDEVYKKSYCACGAYIDGLFDVWDSEGAIDSDFEGEGTAEKPYIISTVEELFGMVRSEGVDDNGSALYFKVADGVSRLYINDTRNMDQDQFNAAAGADTLNNWSYGLLTDTERCPDGGSCGASHYATYTYTFSGYFDGNGVTIYGLYSKTEAAKSSYWAPGTGFVPGLMDDATISNVIFDMSYIENSEGYAAVITSSFGAWTSRYTNGLCESITFRVPGDALPVIRNVVIRNANVTTTYSPELTSNGYVAGFVAAHMQSKGLRIYNCLFDGSTSTLNSSATNKKYAGMFATPSGNTYAVQIEDSLVTNTTSNFDTVNFGSFNEGYDLIHNSYAYGVDGSTYGTLKADDYTTVDALPMLNWTAWDIDAVDVYGTPMPKLVDGWEIKNFRYYKDAYKNSEYYKNPEGATPVDTGYEQGVFSDFDELMGTGTESDPYIIDNANLLFEIIASGGTNRGIGQYFKLACDIDLGGIQWVNYQTDADRNDDYGKVYYQYKPFAGTIDGDGHTITGMYTATTDINAGFIPELTATGEVKNLHFRESYAYASGGSYGIIAGTAASGSKIEGCSIEGGVADKFVGSGSATITDSYCGEEATNATINSETLFDGTNFDTAVWYKGASGEYKLFSKALAMPCADIDGDGEGYEYSTNDLTALKNRLLRKSEYANVYGDVSRNGVVNIRDMVILQREIIAMSANDPDSEWTILDGFWKNVKAGNFSIYYDENDNYDFARKLELYLEEATGVDVAKTLGTTNANLTIRIVTDTTLGVNNYSIDYNIETGVLTISGGSFTAVEQGVLAFIAGSNAVTGDVYTGTGAIDPYKTAVTVGDQPYYYVWGDEFDTAVNGTVSYDKWLLRNKNVDTTLDNDDDSDDHETEFAYISAATDAQAPTINTVSDGKLTLKRGINSSTDMYASGISSKNSMLYKQGYAEMLVTLPSDGYAFPAWWLLTSPGSYTNYGIERSLYGKVYELNNSGTYKFDGTTAEFSADDPTTFQYKLPTQTLEIDIFEIIQRLGVRYNFGDGYIINASEDYDVCFNIHKWYSHATVKNDTTLTVYDLDWANIEANGGFTNKLLTATGSNGENYAGTNTSGVSTYDKIYVHTENLTDGQANGSITYQGGKSNTSVSPGAAGNSMNVNMATYRSNGQVRQLKYGLLWTENDMTFSIYDGSTLVYSTTVNKDSMNYNSAESYSAGNYGFDQYAYMLIENHWYTAAQRSNGTWYYASISDCDMVIDYVRLYQLDGARDIVTPETEAFNSNNRFGN